MPVSDRRPGPNLSDRLPVPLITPANVTESLADQKLERQLVGDISGDDSSRSSPYRFLKRLRRWRGAGVALTP